MVSISNHQGEDEKTPLSMASTELSRMSNPEQTPVLEVGESRRVDFNLQSFFTVI